MLSVHCPTHGREVLLTAGRIDQVMNTTKGIVLRWRCWCGTTGHLRTGAGSWWGAPASEPHDPEDGTGDAGPEMEAGPEPVEPAAEAEPAVPSVESAA